MMPGTTTAAVPPSNLTGRGPPPAALAREHRYSSRSNSFSSASVVTVKRTASLSSSSTGTGTGTRSSAMPIHSQTTGEPALIALRVGRDSTARDHRRRKSVAIDAAEYDGPNGANRWSHSSTTSSATSFAASRRRSRASSGAVMTSALATSSISSPARDHTRMDRSSRGSPHRSPISSRAKSHHRRQSSAASPDRSIRRASRPDFVNTLTALPPLHKMPVSTAFIRPDSPPTATLTHVPPSSYESYTSDSLGYETYPRIAMTSEQSGWARTNTAPGAHARSPMDTPQEQQSPRKSRTSDGRGHTSRPSTGDGSGHRRTNTRDGPDKDKKLMLSKALQKANTAVLLDNAQNFEGALEAYNDACRLLQQVMDRSSAIDDRRKLEAIKVTYTNRISELEESEMKRPPTADDKDLPARPMSEDSLTGPSSDHVETIDAQTQGMKVPGITNPWTGEGFHPHTMQSIEGSSASSFGRQRDFSSPVVESAQAPREMVQRMQPHISSQSTHLSAVETNPYMPAPLSPRKLPSSEELHPEPEQPAQQQVDSVRPHETSPKHHRRTSTTSTSWLDSIDETGSSSPSSVHSKSSKTGLRRKHLRNTSGDTDPDFDAAFDAAVEAAYDEGMEPDLEARREREIALARARKGSVQAPSEKVLSPINGLFSGTSRTDPDDAEEERILDEITSEYAQGFNFDLSNKSALPRQSDSSGYSRSTWQSSQASGDRATAATSLSTVAEDGLSARLAEDAASVASSVNTVKRGPPSHLPPAPPPPTIALPQLPDPGQSRLSTVRSRRLSGQLAKQLKIETSTAKPVADRQLHQVSSPRHDMLEELLPTEDGPRNSATVASTLVDRQSARHLRAPPMLNLRSATSDSGLPTLTKEGEWRRSLDEISDQPLTSARPVLVHRNKSSISLRAEHMVLLATPDVEHTPFIMTPMSSTFMPFASKRNQDPLHSQRAQLPYLDASLASAVSSDGIHLFDTFVASPLSFGSPRTPGGVSTGLEPCPESSLLRPFWLMRAIGSTLTHPRGGYVTTRLFVPHEVWQTRNVKLKSVEDKIANCDLLTAALGRLAGVDTLDADAVMTELQAFEDVMERVQISLVKKLGGDVGVHGVVGSFKDGPTGSAPPSSHGTGSDTMSGAERTKSKENKGSYLSSWRKLRSKSSGAPLVTPSSAVHRIKEKDLPTMPSVPMTSFIPVERRGHKKDVRNMTFDGPNKEYMSSLARLFDGAQVLDHIARQVEDPGLKHSSPTHVGLELSIRHAAEFFGFYVCRFALADLGTLMDKYIKRGTEWVLT